MQAIALPGALLLALVALVGCGQAPVGSGSSDLTQKKHKQGCATHESCKEGQYCAFSDGVCGQGELGVCKVQVTECPELDDPVCGCDGQTYANGCEAGLVFMSIAYDGACAATTPTANEEPPGGGPPAGGACGGVDCGGGQYCDWPDGSCGEYQGAGGICKDPSGPCTGKYAPVCGCDGVTYDTKCDAMVNGASIRHEGGC